MSLQLHEDDALREVHEINMTPFIDVMLVLLIIFMVAAPLATVDVRVDLPESSAQPAPRPSEPLYLSIRRDQQLFLGEQPVSLADLAGALDRLTRGNQEETVFVRGDRDVDYAALMRVMDGLRAAGYLKIGLVGLEAAPAP